jgi:hypothetical protein
MEVMSTAPAPSAVPKRTAVLISSRCRVDGIIFYHHRRRHNNGRTNYYGGRRLLDNDRRRRSVPVGVSSLIPWNLAIGRYGQIGGHCR